MRYKTVKTAEMEFNQDWTNKAIKDGNYQFLPSRKIPGMSIGEYIEIRYEIAKKQNEKIYTKRMGR